MSDNVFDYRDFIHHNRVQAGLALLMLDVRAARQYLARNKQIHRAERLAERRHHVW